MSVVKNNTLNDKEPSNIIEHDNNETVKISAGCFPFKTAVLIILTWEIQVGRLTNIHHAHL